MRTIENIRMVNPEKIQYRVAYVFGQDRATGIVHRPFWTWRSTPEAALDCFQEFLGSTIDAVYDMWIEAGIPIVYDTVN